MTRNFLYFTLLTFILTLTLVAPPVAAQTDDEAEDIDRMKVIGNPAALRRIAGSAHVITADDLARFEYDDIKRILREVPGIYLIEEEGFGQRPNIGMRGSGTDRSSRITLLEDGILVAPAPYAAPAAYYFPTTARMSAVEARKGSASIKHGPYTTGGALNLVSTPIPGRPTGYVALDFGSHATRKLHAWYGDTGTEFGYLLETVQQFSDGFKRLDNGVDTGYTLADYLLKLRWNPTGAPAHGFALKLGATDHGADETYLGLTAGDFAVMPTRRYAGSQVDRLDTDHRQYQLRHDWISANGVDFTTVAYSNYFSRAWYKLQSVGGAGLSAVLERPDEFVDQMDWLRGADSPADALVVRNNARDYYARGIQSVIGWRASWNATLHDFEIGLRLHRDEEDRLQEQDAYQMVNGVMTLTTTGARGSQENRVGEAEVTALFIQDEIRHGDWTITAGLRHERIRGTRENFNLADPTRSAGPTQVRVNRESVTIPGIGINRGLGDSMNMFISVHSGFTPPAPGSTSSAEKSVNYEYGIRYGTGALSADLAGFTNDYSNMVGTCTASTGGGCNIGDQFDAGKVRMHGIEASLRYALEYGNGWTMPLRLAWTWTDAEFRTSFNSAFSEFGVVTRGDGLAYLPSHQGQFSTGLERGDWRLDLNLGWVDEMRTRAGMERPPRTERTDDSLIVDLAVRRRLGERSSAFLRVDNLLDESYIVAWRPAGARPGKPRQLSLGVRFGF